MKLRKILRNKKAADEPGFISVGLILAVLILILLVAGLYYAYRNWDKVKLYFAGGATADDFVNSCSTICKTYGYERDNYNAKQAITFADGFKTKISCKDAESTIAACIDANGKASNTLLKKEDCEKDKKGTFAEKICLNSDGQTLYESATSKCNSNDDKYYATFCYTTADDGKYNIITDATTKSSCEGTNTWNETYKSALISPVCDNPGTLG